MLKILGLASVVFSTTAMGFNLASNIENHCGVLRRTLEMLEEMQILLEYGVQTKEEIFTKIFSLDRYAIISQSNLEDTLLSQSEKEQLSEFYDRFGLTDLQGQLSYIQMIKSFFNHNLCELEKTKANKCKLYRTAGVLAGILLCLIII